MDLRKFSNRVKRVSGNLFDRFYRKKIEQIDPDVVYHLAWYSNFDYLTNPLNWEWYVHSLDFISFCVKLGVKKIIVAGTCLERKPEHPYSEAKNKLQRDSFKICEGTDTTIAWARIFYAYGDGMLENKLIARLGNCFRMNKAITLRSDGLAKKDYIHTSDIAQAMRLMLKCGCNGVYEVGTGVGLNAREIVSTFQIMFPRELVRYSNDPDKLGDVIASSIQLKSLGFVQKHSVKAWIRKNY